MTVDDVNDNSTDVVVNVTVPLPSRIMRSRVIPLSSQRGPVPGSQA